MGYDFHHIILFHTASDTALEVLTQHVHCVMNQSVCRCRAKYFAESQQVRKLRLSCAVLLRLSCDTFETVPSLMGKARRQGADLHEKLCLYYVTEMTCVVAQMHACDVIHLASFLVKNAGETSELRF